MLANISFDTHLKYTATRTLESGEVEIINVIGTDIDDANLVAIDKSKHTSDQLFSITQRID